MKEKIYEFTATLDNVEIGAGGIEDSVIAACAKDVSKRQGTYKITVFWCSPDDCNCVGFYHKESCPHYVECY